MRSNISRFRVGGWMVVLCIMALTALAGSIRADVLSSQVAPAPWADPLLRGKIDPTLLKQMGMAKTNEWLPIIVEMNGQADLSAATAKLPDRVAAGTWVVQALQATAESSQREVRAFLAAEESAGRANTVRPLWIVNAVGAHVTPQTVWQLAARPDVALVRADRWRQWIESSVPPVGHPALWASNLRFPISDFRFLTPDLRLPFSDFQPPTSDLQLPTSNVEWGISQIRADQVWAALNITGAGVVVANMDTGVDWLHPALASNYRGCVKGLCQHAKSWYDATDGGATYPVDGHGHGTHTMGTLAGQDGIGVAPGAQWIAARILDSTGAGYDTWIHAGFQWLLAPGGDAAMSPDVVSSSWGTNDGSSTIFQNDLRALRAAGILPVFSAGNNGPRGGTVGSPASLPEAFAVGAIDDTDLVAYFSSRGPSLWGEIRPHVVAPGVAIRSAWPGGSYQLLKGTSMAAPHVAGVAALMLSARPGLSITTTAYVLTTTAVPLTTTIPNNESGWGRVDAYAAVMAVASAGALSGTVSRGDTLAPIPGALVTAIGIQSASAQTDADGRYALGVAAGVYNVSASAFGYESGHAFNVIVPTGTLVVRNFQLTPLPTGAVQGAITDGASGAPVTAMVTVLDTPVAQTAFGVYSLTLPAGTHTLRAATLGYRVLTVMVTIAAGETTAQNLSMTPGPKILLVDSGAWYSQSEIGYFQQALDGLGYVYNTWPIRRLPGDTPRGRDLAPYDVVIWSSPFDSPGYVGANGAIMTFLTGTHSLMISGQDVAYWESGVSLEVQAPYLEDYLKTRYVRDDSGSRSLSGLGGEIMAGLIMTIAGPGGADDQLFPDEIAVGDPDRAAQILAYQDDGSGGQKVGMCLPYRGVVLSFGYEAITEQAARRTVMQRAMEYFASPPQSAGLSLRPASETIVARSGDVVTHTLLLRNTSEISSDTVTLTIAGGAWPRAFSPATAVVSSCNAITVALVVTIPPGLDWHVMDVVTLTAQSSLLPSVMATSVLTTKTPAPVLLVEDERWYDVLDAYEQALTQVGVAHDTWQVNQVASSNVLSVSHMAWYPVVVWFTAYDWYDPINAADEANFAQLLDGGGRLFLSSPFYLDVMGVTPFVQNRLGVMTFTDNLTTSIAYGAAGDPIGDGLGALALTNPYPRAGFFTLAEALFPGRAAATALRGGHDRALAIRRAAANSRAVFMITPFEALSGEGAARVMGRIVGWLGWLGDSTLEAGRGVVAPGDSVAVTLTARNNGPAPVHASMTATLPLSVTFLSMSLTPGATFEPLAGVVTWAGVLEPAASSVVTYQVMLDSALTGTLALPMGTPLTTTAVFRDDTHGISFDQSAMMRVEAPDLTLSSFAAPSPVRPNAPLTYTLVILNSGRSPAALAGAKILLPLQVPLVPDSPTLSGSGLVTTTDGTISWDGSLDAGQSATLTYRLDTLTMLSGGSLLSEALLWDGAGGAWERAAWVEVSPHRVYLPVVWVGRNSPPN